MSPAGLLSWCVSYRFPVSLTGWMAGFRAFPVSLSPFIALRAFEKNARPRAHLLVYELAPSLVLLLLLVLLVVLAPACLPVLLVPLRHCTDFVLARCLLQFMGGCSSTYATAQAIDCGIVYGPAIALPDLFFSERLGSVAPLLRLTPLTVTWLLVPPTLGRTCPSVNGRVQQHLCYGSSH